MPARAILLLALVFAAAAGASTGRPAAGDPVLFWADDGHGLALWRSDGTARGTVLVRGFEPDRLGDPAGYPPSLRRSVLFSQRDSLHGDELWKTDGTPKGTVLIRDIRPGPAGSGAGVVGEVDNDVLFFANDDLHGRQLWRTDGTRAGTVRLTRLPGLGYQLAPWSAAAHEAIYFAAYDARLRLELWRSDGTAAGTRRIDVNGPSSGDLSWLVPSGRRLFFEIDGHELWMTEGDARARHVADLPDGLVGLAGFRGGVLFLTDAGSTIDLWRSDGTADGTVRLRRFNGASDHALTSLEVLGGRAVISAADDAGRFGLWTTDGTVEGTVLVKRAGSPHGFATLDGVIYFRVTGGSGEELWRTDLSASGTRLVRVVDGRGGYSLSQLFAAGRTLYLSVWDKRHGLELWKSDGTTHGTVFVKDINQGRRDSGPVFLQAPALADLRGARP
jgi:ELWxxDGT repeat protein